MKPQSHRPETADMLVVKTPVAGIQEGDVFAFEGRVHWQALDAAEEGEEGTVSLLVQHWPDGGTSTRVWSDGDVELDILRDA